jgi:hypothetical protein
MARREPKQDERSFQESLETLRRFLNAQSGGDLADAQTLATLLAPIWNRLDGGDASAMAADKLDRLETASWLSPRLVFRIERHGGRVLGSSRGEIQEWTLDLDTLTAQVSDVSHRQLAPRRKRLDINLIAVRITATIREGADEQWLEWSSDRSEVRVLTSHFINPDRASKETLDGRRKRLKRALCDELTKIGWIPMSQPGRYRRSGAQSG